MELYRCSKCSSEYVFRRAVCPKCGSKGFESVEVKNVVALDSVHLIATPEPFPDDYSVVMFQTDNGARGFCRTTSDVKRGDRLRIGMDENGPVCEPE